MKTILMMILLTGLNAGAETLSCQVEKPCDYDSGSIKSCITSIVIDIEGTAATETIYFRPANIAHEVFLIPHMYDVDFEKSETAFSFQDETGDQTGHLNLTSAGTYEGFITVDQDFEFAASCTVK